MYVNVRTKCGKWLGCLGIRRMGESGYSYETLYPEASERGKRYVGVSHLCYKLLAIHAQFVHHRRELEGGKS
jgi:hypothetical protein